MSDMSRVMVPEALRKLAPAKAGADIFSPPEVPRPATSGHGIVPADAPPPRIRLLDDPHGKFRMALIKLMRVGHGPRFEHSGGEMPFRFHADAHGDWARLARDVKTATEDPSFSLPPSSTERFAREELSNRALDELSRLAPQITWARDFLPYAFAPATSEFAQDEFAHMLTTLSMQRDLAPGAVTAFLTQIGSRQSTCGALMLACTSVSLAEARRYANPSTGEIVRALESHHKQLEHLAEAVAYLAPLSVRVPEIAAEIEERRQQAANRRAAAERENEARQLRLKAERQRRASAAAQEREKQDAENSRRKAFLTAMKAGAIEAELGRLSVGIDAEWIIEARRFHRRPATGPENARDLKQKS